MRPMGSFRRQASADDMPNAIVGAARRVHIDRREEVQALRERGIDERQMLAWRYYDLIAEIKAAYNYFAAVGSRIRFFAGYVPDGEMNPAPIGTVGNVDRSLVAAARYELAKLNNGRGGQPSFIRAFLLNLLVAGECYIVGSNGKWSIRSTSELRFEQDNKVRMVISRYQRGQYMHYLPEDAFIARVWRMHPQYSDDADAAMHGVLAECGEMLLLNRLIRASARSRLNAGLLYVADELRFQRSSDPDGAESEPDVDPFEEELTLALTDPIGDTDSPAEIVPLIIRGPAEFSENGIKTIDLGRTFDPVLIQRHDQTLQRILTGLEIPQDMISGFSKVRFSNVQAVSQDFLKSYLEPMATLIAEALTTVFLRPALIARGFNHTDVEKIHVWYDPSAVVLQPDKSQDADNGYKQMLVSGAAWRRHHGFTEADAPSAEELVRRVGLTGAVPPNAIVDMMRQLAPELIEHAEKIAGHSMDQPVPGSDQGMIKNTDQPDGATTGDTNVTRNPAHQGPGGSGIGSGKTGPRPHGSADPMANVQPGGPMKPSNPQQAPEGSLPNRPGRAPNGTTAQESALHVESERVDQLISVLRSLTAAGQIESAGVTAVNRKLERALDAERQLRDQLSVALNDGMRRILERAGARTVSKVRRDHELKSLVVDVPITEVFSHIPASRHGEFGLDEDELIKEVAELAEDVFFHYVSRSQKQAWKQLGMHVFEQMKLVNGPELADAVKWLKAELITLAKKFLHKPKTDPNQNYVPMSVIRDAATLAGGGKLEDAPADTIVPRSKPQDNGRAILSQQAMDAMASDDNPEKVTFGRKYRWVYGISDNHFEPHLELDGRVFDSWTSGELAAHDEGVSWPYTTHYYPGDHNGCRCDWLPEVLDVAAVNKAERGDTARLVASSDADA